MFRVAVIFISSVLFLVMLVVVLNALTYLFFYLPDITEARNRLEKVESHTFQTSANLPMEYLNEGEGLPLLIVHGLAGGYDNTSTHIDHILPTGYNLIIPSRFGYPGSPMPEEATLKAQADIMAELLNYLEIDRVAVVAHSTGSSTAIKLAHSYPERISALVLLSADFDCLAENRQPVKGLFKKVLTSDYLFWAMSGPFFNNAVKYLVPSAEDLSREKYNRTRVIIESILPAAERREGVNFDLLLLSDELKQEEMVTFFRNLNMPVLAINAADDYLTCYEAARELEENLPRVQFLGIDEGGPLFLNKPGQVLQEIEKFLESNLP